MKDLDAKAHLHKLLFPLANDKILRLWTFKMYYIQLIDVGQFQSVGFSSQMSIF